MFEKNLNHKWGKITRGYFEIGGKRMFFRSKWEANYALYLEFLVQKGHIKSWKYEGKIFIFEKIQFGTRSYRPDFTVETNNGAIEYHEVKGYMTPQSRTKLKRMAKYFPHERIVLIDSSAYKSIERSAGGLLKFYE